MKNIAVITLIFLCFTTKAQQYLLIGTYTGGKSEGIYVYNFNTQNADNNLVSTTKSINPSFINVSENKKFVYAVNEMADTTILPIGGTVSAYSFNNKTGNLSFINMQPSGGKDPCFVTSTSNNKWLFTGNYSSGTVGILPLNADGSLNKLNQVVVHHGSSLNKERQEAPHVHSTNLSQNNKLLYVADLGIDKLNIYRFNNKKGKLKLKYSINSIAGSGPRHFTFDNTQKFAYLMEELSGTIAVYHKKTNGKLKLLQRLSALPKQFKGTNTSADIHISLDGKYLYCSNRGESNSISIFFINNNGTLILKDNIACLGKTPRNFCFDPSGNFLLVANQNSDNIVIFKVDKQTGFLTDTGKRIDVPNPVCLKWIN